MLKGGSLTVTRAEHKENLKPRLWTQKYDALGLGGLEKGLN